MLGRKTEEVVIRAEGSDDLSAVRVIHSRAFGRDDEADLVDALRLACPDYVSLVAEVDAMPVGHIAFTPVVVDSPGKQQKGMGLAPVAVLPEFQRSGIGSRLIEAGLALLCQGGWPFVVLVGDPAYYGRFGFLPASQFGVICEFSGVPDEAFMIRILAGPWPQDVRGAARYHPEFHRFA